jgi:hypothetical protein
MADEDANGTELAKVGRRTARVDAALRDRPVYAKYMTQISKQAIADRRPANPMTNVMVAKDDI